MLTRLRLSNTYRPCDVIQYWHRDGQMLLDAPYQRGDVWGYKRRINLIRSLLLGVPIPSIVINDRFAAGWSDTLSCVVIDGKQRITTILMWFNDVLEVPGEWFDRPGLVRYSDLESRMQRYFRMHALAFCEAQLPSIEAEKEVFELINFGGVPQGETD